MHVYVLLLSSSTTRGLTERVLRRTPLVCSVTGVIVNRLLFCVIAPEEDEDQAAVTETLEDSKMVAVQLRVMLAPSKCFPSEGLLSRETTGGGAGFRRTTQYHTEEGSYSVISIPATVSVYC